MSRDEENAVMALKNAWLGAVNTGQDVAAASPGVQALPDDTPIASLDFDGYYRILAAHANAVMGLLAQVDELKSRMDKNEE